VSASVLLVGRAELGGRDARERPALSNLPVTGRPLCPYTTVPGPGQSLAQDIGFLKLPTMRSTGWNSEQQGSSVLPMRMRQGK